MLTKYSQLAQNVIISHMADKPKIKVEEISDEKNEEKSVETQDNKSGDEKEETTSSSPPKVASFSQLDSSETSDVKTDNKDEEKPTEDSVEVEAESEKEEVKSNEAPNEDAKSQEEVSTSEVKEWLKEVRPDTSKEVSKSGGPNFRALIIIVIVLLVLGAIVGGVIYYQRGVEQRQEEPSSDTPIVTTSSPTPTEVPEEVDLTAYSVNILNGSGTAGEAGNAENLLTDTGFSAENIEAGNADSFDYEATEVSLKEETPEAVFEAIQTALGDTYNVERTEEPLEDSSEYDILIIVGQRAEAS